MTPLITPLLAYLLLSTAVALVAARAMAIHREAHMIDLLDNALEALDADRGAGRIDDTELAAAARRLIEHAAAIVVMQKLLADAPAACGIAHAELGLTDAQPYLVIVAQRNTLTAWRDYLDLRDYMGPFKSDHGPRVQAWYGQCAVLLTVKPEYDLQRMQVAA